MHLLKFEQPNCVPCKNVGDYLDGLNITYSKVIPFNDPDLAMKYKVRTVPVLVLIDNDEKEIGRTIGFKPNEIDGLIQKLK